MMVFAGTVAAQAYDYRYLTFRKTDGTTQAVSVESLTLTVADGQLVAENADGRTTLALGELSSMYFDNGLTGIDGVSASAADGTVEVFSVSGMFLGRFGSMKQAGTSLEKGVYIIRTDGQTRKEVIR